jgi:hypothetical protein
VYYLALAVACSDDEKPHSVAALFGPADGSVPFTRLSASLAVDAEAALRDILMWCHTLAVQHEELGARPGVIKIVCEASDLDLRRLDAAATWEQSLRYLGTPRPHEIVVPAEILAQRKAQTAWAQWMRETYLDVVEDTQTLAGRATRLYCQCVFLARVHGLLV